MALWHDDELCGLCLGHMSRDDKHNVIEYIEGSPVENHPLKGYVLDIILTAGFEYAKYCGKRSLILREPVAGLSKIYQEQFGFELREKGIFGKTPYCIKEVKKQ